MDGIALMRAVVFVFTLAVAATAAGQSIGANISGVVVDESGGRIARATVTITNAATGRSATTTAGAEGDYRIVALLPGEYDIAVVHDGFAPVAQRITLLVGSETTLSFTLRIAGVDLKATASADARLIEPARSQPWSSVSKSQVDALPVLDRNFLVLAQLLPGSGPLNSTVARFAVTKFGGVADQRSGYTTIVDGGDVDDAQWGSPTINVGQDAVQEFKVFRSQFDAQYGHALNAVVTVATRSGTNRVGGTGFYFGRDDALNAPNAFASGKPPFDEQRVGGSVGGPVVRNRSHFFGAYERDAVDNVRIIALPPTNILAATENGVFPAESFDGLATLRLDHRVSAAHGLSLRYNGENQRSQRAAVAVTSDTSQIDTVNRSHSVVAESLWAPASHAANAFRVHVLDHTLATVARNSITAVQRPAGNIGQTNRDSQVVPRTKLGLTDVVYLHRGRHDLKIGGEYGFTTHDFDAHVLEYGLFQFQTDATFDPNVPGTWPTMFQQQKPTSVTHRSQELAGFLQDDWTVGTRVRVNAGLRYDIDLTLRMNDYYARKLDDASLAGLARFVSRRRGTDTNNVQPRLGATWDTRGDGRLIVRGGSGIYVSRNRPWYQLRSMNQFESSVVRITDPALLRRYPDIDAVLGGRSLDSFIAAVGSRNLGTVIPDDFVQPYAVNTTAGVGWQFGGRAALDVDYVHSYGAHQIGSTDRNLPPSGVLSAANPRPVPQFNQVVMLENFSESWYDGLEAQLRTSVNGNNSLQVSYTLSRSYLDGVDFFLTMRGTQRTPRERGYNPSDQRHNLTVAASRTLPWDVEISGILKLVSGSPIKVQAGVDLDGDSAPTGDLPPGVPITVGRDRVDESLAAINAFRAARNLAPVARPLLSLDPYRSLELRVAKTVRVGAARMTVMIEGFNITNSVNLRPPVGSDPGAGVSLTTASALVRTVARDARQIQWGVRYAF